MLVENFVLLILLVLWDRAQVVNPRPIAKPNVGGNVTGKNFSFKKISTDNFLTKILHVDKYTTLKTIDND